MAKLALGREKIIGGTTIPRQRFAELFEEASSGTPVVIVPGDRQVLMIDRNIVLELLQRDDPQDGLGAAPNPYTRDAYARDSGPGLPGDPLQVVGI